MIQFEGACPVCEQQTTFSSVDEWYRDHLRCAKCDSIPRERAFSWAMATYIPDWETKIIHESSPADRRVSLKLQEHAKQYIPSQYFPGVQPGTVHEGMRSENLEVLTFKDNSIDIHAHLDVMEHVNRPDLCVREMYRTLRPGGKAIFTTPVYKDLPVTKRRAIYFPDGVEHLETPEYHGNPINDEGALVTFHYGMNFPGLLLLWEPRFTLEHYNPEDKPAGIIGEFRDVFILTKAG